MLTNIPSPLTPINLPSNALITLEDNSTLSVYIKLTKDQLKYDRIENINPGSSLVKGRLVNPKLLPELVKEGVRAKIQFNDNSTNFKINGILIFQKVIQHPFSASMNSILGATFEGEIIQEALDNQGNNSDPFNS